MRQKKDNKGNGASDPAGKLPEIIFIDADALVSLIDKKDPNHNLAVKLQKVIRQDDISVFTSNFAIGEAITVISQKLGLKLAVEFGKKIFAGEIKIIDVSRSHCEDALKKFAKQTTKNARFTDMVNMVLMDVLKIDTIFSFDEHYPKNGYKLLGDK